MDGQVGTLDCLVDQVASKNLTVLVLSLLVHEVVRVHIGLRHLKVRFLLGLSARSLKFVELLDALELILSRGSRVDVQRVYLGHKLDHVLRELRTLLSQVLVVTVGEVDVGQDVLRVVLLVAAS